MPVIRINGVQHRFGGVEVTYRDVVDAAGLTGFPTVVFQGPRCSGELHVGQTMLIYEGIKMNVVHTGNA